LNLRFVYSIIIIYHNFFFMQLVGTLKLIFENPDFSVAAFESPLKLIHELYGSDAWLELTVFGDQGEGGNLAS